MHAQTLSQSKKNETTHLFHHKIPSLQVPGHALPSGFLAHVHQCQLRNVQVGMGALDGGIKNHPDVTSSTVLVDW
jgi:hypothetical protein